MTSAPPSLDRSLRPVTVGLCTLIVAIAFEVIAVATAMPAAAADLDGLGGYAWAFSAFLIGMLFSTVVSGGWCDRVGPIRPLVAGMVVFVAGLVLAGTAGAMSVLVAGRLVQGLGSGLMNVALYVVVARFYPVERRPRIFTYISTAWVLPAFLGPPVAALLTHRLSWHWVFIAVVPFVLLGAALVLPSLWGRPLPAPEERPARAPLWSAGLVALGAAALQYAGQRLDLVAVLPALLGLAALVVGLPPLMPAGILRLRAGLPMVVLSRGLIQGAFVGAEAFVPLMLVQQRSVSLLAAGLVLTAGSSGWFTGAWLQSQSFLHVRRDLLIVAGAASVTVGLGLVTGTAYLTGWWAGTAAVGWACCGFGMGLASASTSIAVMGLSGPSEQGRNASSLSLADALGSGLGVALTGAVYAALRTTATGQVTFALVFLAMVIVGGLTVLVALRIGRLPQPG